MEIICNDVTLGYNSKIVSKNINFSIEHGDYLIIIGENGCGKSTLVKTLLGLTPIISGELSLGNGLLKNEIGYLPQQSDLQKDFPASVYEVVISGFLNKCKLRPFYNKEEKIKTLENMEKLDILNLKDQCFRNLSGGQRQRVLLARALCSTSKLLLLDEPVSGLDPNTTKELYKLIKKLNEDTTIIMISHDIETSMSHANKVLHLKKFDVNKEESKHHFFGSKEQYVTDFLNSK